MPKPQRGAFERVARGVAVALAGLLVLLLLLVLAGVLWLSQADLKPIVEKHASQALDRRVSLGSLEVEWGNPLGIEVTDLAIANASWGSNPDMIQIGRISALLSLRPLLQGIFHYDRLRIADAIVTLERNAEGLGNWRFGGGSNRLPLIPSNRTEFPTLLDFVGENGLVTYRARGGSFHGVRLDRIEVSAPDAESRVQLSASGAYNDVVLRLEGRTASFEALRDDTVRYEERFTLTGRNSTLAFRGALRKPLDFDGVRGELSIDARSLDDLLATFGSRTKADVPLSIAGILRRDGDRWHLAAAKGEIMQSALTGRLGVLEGGAGEADDLNLDLDFRALDIDRIIASVAGRGRTELGAMPLHPDVLDEVNATAELTSAQVTLGGRTVRAVTFRGRLLDGGVTLRELVFALGGGTLDVTGSLEESGSGGRLALDVRARNADMNKMAQELGASSGDFRGQLNGAARLNMRGRTLGSAWKSSDGAAVVRLRDGFVARSLIERLSMDLRGLFRTNEARVPISCMIGVLTLTDGLGIISPFRLETPVATVIGSGKIRLADRTLELTLKSLEDTTNFLALDVPIRIAGEFSDLEIQPLFGREGDWLKQDTALTSNLPPELDRMAVQSPCWQ